jgi:hypothetical protein
VVDREFSLREFGDVLAPEMDESKWDETQEIDNEHGKANTKALRCMWCYEMGKAGSCDL